MNTVKALLPPGSSLLEKRAAECLQQAVQNPIKFANLINPHKCPVKFLPYLAWALSVDYWEEHWSEELKEKPLFDLLKNTERKAQQVQCEELWNLSAMLLKSVSGLRKNGNGSPGRLGFC